MPGRRGSCAAFGCNAEPVVDEVVSLPSPRILIEQRVPFCADHGAAFLGDAARYVYVDQVSTGTSSIRVLFTGEFGDGALGGGAGGTE